MAKETTINVQETPITILSVYDNDYFSLTDIARRFNPESPADIIANWFRSCFKFIFYLIQRHNSSYPI